MTVYSQIISNKMLGASITAWFTAQILKVVFVYFKAGKVDFARLIGSGGMPSSHSSFVVALSVSVGRVRGYDSAEFAIATVFALIVMYDAAGVRRAAGKQAKVLNNIIKDTQMTGKVSEEKLKELIGHTPIEVIAGAIIGVATAAFI